MRPGLVRLARVVLPPRPVLVLALVVVASLAAVTVATLWLTGPLVALSVALGMAAGLPASVGVMRPAPRIAAGLLCAVAGAVAVSAAHPWGLAAVVGLAGLLQAPLTTTFAGVGIWASVVAAVLGSLAGEAPWYGVGVAVLVGYALAHAVTAAARVPRRSVPLPWALAIRHATVFAVLATGTFLAAGALDLPHPYWAVVALAAAMRPRPAEARAAARSIFVGTGVGVVLAIVVAATLPRLLTILVLGVCAVLMVGWALAGDPGRQAWFGTPVIVLLSSSGVLRDELSVAFERAMLTAVAVLLALVAAWLLRDLENTLAPPTSADAAATSAGPGSAPDASAPGTPSVPDTRRDEGEERTSVDT